MKLQAVVKSSYAFGQSHYLHTYFFPIKKNWSITWCIKHLIISKLKFSIWRSFKIKSFVDIIIQILPAPHLEEIQHHYIRMKEDGLKLEKKKKILKNPNLYLKTFKKSISVFISQLLKFIDKSTDDIKNTTK